MAVTAALLAQSEMVPESVIRPTTPPTPACALTEPDTLTPLTVPSSMSSPTAPPASSLPGTSMATPSRTTSRTVPPFTMPNRPTAKSASELVVMERPLTLWPAPSKVPAKGVLPDAAPLPLRVPAPMGVHSTWAKSMSSASFTVLPEKSLPSFTASRKRHSWFASATR